MIRTITRLLISLLPGACSLVHPVKVTPPPAPKAFLSDLAIAPSKASSAPATPGSAPGAAERATASTVWWNAKRRKWQYELAFKTAIGRVQDALLQENSQAESLRSLRAQVELGRRLLEEARKIFEQGQSDYLPVLNALSSLAALERGILRAQRLLLSYRIQLYRALGGTWSYEVTKRPG
jgi:hypothetical protein